MFFRSEVLAVLWPALGNFLGEQPVEPQGWPAVFQQLDWFHVALNTHTKN